MTAIVWHLGGGKYRQAPEADHFFVGASDSRPHAAPRNERCACGTRLSRYNSTSTCSSCEARRRRELAHA